MAKGKYDKRKYPLRKVLKEDGLMYSSILILRDEAEIKKAKNVLGR
ncbi:hypothetical protein [Bacillus safensis]|nr:hypothetical protein [Bacillus safensis]